MLLFAWQSSRDVIIGSPRKRWQCPMMNRKIASSVISDLFLRETKLHSRRHALIERVNTRRVRSASKKSIFARSSALAFYFSRPPVHPPLPRLAARLHPLPYSRVCKPVSCLAHSLTTNFVNGFHSGGFSRFSRAISGVPFFSFFLRLFAALIACLSNCHFLRQIVLSRVGVTDTRIKLEEKKRRAAKGGREKGRERGRLKDAVRDKPWGRMLVSFAAVNITIRV